MDIKINDLDNLFGMLFWGSVCLALTLYGLKIIKGWFFSSYVYHNHDYDQTNPRLKISRGQIDPLFTDKGARVERKIEPIDVPPADDDMVVYPGYYEG